MYNTTYMYCYFRSIFVFKYSPVTIKSNSEAGQWFSSTRFQKLKKHLLQLSGISLVYGYDYDEKKSKLTMIKTVRLQNKMYSYGGLWKLYYNILT